MRRWLGYGLRAVLLIPAASALVMASSGPADSGVIAARILFNKPRLVVDDLNPAHGWLDFKNTVRIAAPFVHVQCWIEVDGLASMVEEKVTDAQGIVRFEGRLGCQYHLRAIPIFSRMEGAKSLASAAIYRQEDPRYTERPGHDKPVTLANYPDAAIQALGWPDETSLTDAPALRIREPSGPPVDWVIPVSDTKAGRKSGPFNILWMVYQSLEWVLSQDPGLAPLPTIHINWDPSSNLPRGTYFNQEGELSFARVNGAHAKDTDEFDDSVLGHELGHFVGRLYHAFISPGGDHGDIDDHAYDSTLTMSEGWATFFQGMVRAQIQAPISPPDYYDTLSPSTSTGDGLLLRQSAEDWRRVRKVSGIHHEGSVARCLWRLYCNPGVQKEDGSTVLDVLRQLPDSDLPILTSWSELVAQASGVDRACVARILQEEGIEGHQLTALPFGPKWVIKPKRVEGALIFPAQEPDGDGSDGSGNRANETAYFYLIPRDSKPFEVRVAVANYPAHADDLLFLESFQRAQSLGEVKVHPREVRHGVTRLVVAGAQAGHRVILRVRVETHGASPPGELVFWISAHEPVSR